MFTGLVHALGSVVEMQPAAAARRLTIAEPRLATSVSLGESVMVNGVCLTVVERDADAMRFDVGPESLRLTNLGELKPGDGVNLERALAVGDRLGGHIVQGHVDGLGRITRRERQGEWETVWIDCPPELARQMIRKGSIAVDGVSLTLVEVTPTSFSVALIPHTLAMTTLGFKQPPATVNLETDLFAKYVCKFLENLPRNE